MWWWNVRQTHYRPFRVGACVAISFLLLGILEERCFLPLLSLCGLIMEVGGGLSVVLVIISLSSPCRVYPPVSTVVSRFLYRDNVGLVLHAEVTSKGRRMQDVATVCPLPGSCHSEYFCRTWITSAPYFSSLSSVTPSICSRASGSEESFSVEKNLSSYMLIV